MPVLEVDWDKLLRFVHHLIPIQSHYRHVIFAIYQSLTPPQFGVHVRMPIVTLGHRIFAKRRYINSYAMWNGIYVWHVRLYIYQPYAPYASLLLDIFNDIVLISIAHVRNTISTVSYIAYTLIYPIHDIYIYLYIFPRHDDMLTFHFICSQFFLGFDRGHCWKWRLCNNRNWYY